jgi:hypothetical protein
MFRKFLRRRDRAMRVLRSKSSRGIPQRGDLKLPDLPEDWRTSMELLPQAKGTINPLSWKDLADDFFKSQAYGAGKLAPSKLYEPPKVEWLPVWPEPSPEAQNRAWTAPRAGKLGRNRDAVIARHIHVANHPLRYPEGWCDICHRHIPALSREALPDDVNESRAKYEAGDARWAESYGDQAHDTEKLERQQEEEEKYDHGTTDADFRHEE